MWLFRQTGFQREVSRAANCQHGNSKGSIARKVQNVLVKSLVPCVSCADRIAASVSGCINCMISCVDRGVIFRRVMEEPLQLEVLSPLKDLFGESFQLVEGEPPEIPVGRVDLVGFAQRQATLS